jgi:ATP-dependent DNA helicase PIF1
VNTINLQIQEQLPGNATSHKSVDTVVDVNESVQYPIEFLSSLEPPGMPPHNLMLKIGSPIILLRNLDAPRLCNGTRPIVKGLMPQVIETTILTGCAHGEDVFLPQIPMIPTDMPFEFKRLQFPIRLAFAISINKAQGQLLQVAGSNLATTCLSHGQLYVSCSRVEIGENLYILAVDGKTKHVVYEGALR